MTWLRRGLAQARRAEDQHMVEGLAAALGGLDVDLHLLAHRLLAEVFVQALGADRGLDGLVLAGGAGGDDAGSFMAALCHRMGAASMAWHESRNA